MAPLETSNAAQRRHHTAVRFVVKLTPAITPAETKWIN